MNLLTLGLYRSGYTRAVFCAHTHRYAKKKKEVMKPKGIRNFPTDFAISNVAMVSRGVGRINILQKGDMKWSLSEFCIKLTTCTEVGSFSLTQGTTVPEPPGLDYVSAPLSPLAGVGFPWRVLITQRIKLLLHKWIC